MIELKESLLPTVQSNKLSEQLSDFCVSISSPSGCSADGVIRPYLTELSDEGALGRTDHEFDLPDIDQTSREEQR